MGFPLNSVINMFRGAEVEGEANYVFNDDPDEFEYPDVRGGAEVFGQGRRVPVAFGGLGAGADDGGPPLVDNRVPEERRREYWRDYRSGSYGVGRAAVNIARAAMEYFYPGGNGLLYDAASGVLGAAVQHGLGSAAGVLYDLPNVVIGESYDQMVPSKFHAPIKQYLSDTGGWSSWHGRGDTYREYAARQRAQKDPKPRLRREAYFSRAEDDVKRYSSRFTPRISSLYQLQYVPRRRVRRLFGKFLVKSGAGSLYK